MKEYNSWKDLLEDFREGNIPEDEVRRTLDDMSYDMSEDELEEAEELLEEYILTLADEGGYMMVHEAIDSIPYGEEEQYYDYNKDLWEMGFKDG